VNWHAERIYRLSARLNRSGHHAAATVVAALNRVLTGVEIAPSADFGPGLVIMHGSGIVVSGGVVSGRDRSIYQQVTLGKDGKSHGVPTLGDRVVIFAGAKVLGGVTIGDDATVGANSVVLQDVPAGRVAVGIPARVLD